MLKLCFKLCKSRKQKCIGFYTICADALVFSLIKERYHEGAYKEGTEQSCQLEDLKEILNSRIAGNAQILLGGFEYSSPPVQDGLRPLTHGLRVFGGNQPVYQLMRALIPLIQWFLFGTRAWRHANDHVLFWKCQREHLVH